MTYDNISNIVWLKRHAATMLAVSRVDLVQCRSAGFRIRGGKVARRIIVGYEYPASALTGWKAAIEQVKQRFPTEEILGLEIAWQEGEGEYTLEYQQSDRGCTPTLRSRRQAVHARCPQSIDSSVALVDRIGMLVLAAVVRDHGFALWPRCFALRVSGFREDEAQTTSRAWEELAHTAKAHSPEDLAPVFEDLSTRRAERKHRFVFGIQKRANEELLATLTLDSVFGPVAVQEWKLSCPEACLQSHLAGLLFLLWLRCLPPPERVYTLPFVRGERSSSAKELEANIDVACSSSPLGPFIAPEWIRTAPATGPYAQIHVAPDSGRVEIVLHIAHGSDPPRIEISRSADGLPVSIASLLMMLPTQAKWNATLEKEDISCGFSLSVKDRPFALLKVATGMTTGFELFDFKIVHNDQAQAEVQVEVSARADRCLLDVFPSSNRSDDRVFRFQSMIARSQIDYIGPVLLYTAVRELCERRLPPLTLSISAAARQALEWASFIGESSDVTVRITGDTGVGKSHVAKLIHGLSLRCKGPFQTLNMAAIPMDLAESLLFGHEKGAFTGAVKKQNGRLLSAFGGTLFLDEIGVLPLGLQAKLLVALQAREVVPVGANAPEKIDVRLITATNTDLEAAVHNGTFREDLFYRINAAVVSLPSLEDRIRASHGRDELYALATLLLAEFQLTRRGKRRVSFELSSAAQSCLRHHLWPGNIRELDNVLRESALKAAFEADRVAKATLRSDSDFDRHNTSEKRAALRRSLNDTAFRDVDKLQYEAVVDNALIEASGTHGSITILPHHLRAGVFGSLRAAPYLDVLGRLLDPDQGLRNLEAAREELKPEEYECLEHILSAAKREHDKHTERHRGTPAGSDSQIQQSAKAKNSRSLFAESSSHGDTRWVWRSKGRGSPPLYGDLRIQWLTTTAYVLSALRHVLRGQQDTLSWSIVGEKDEARVLLAPLDLERVSVEVPSAAAFTRDYIDQIVTGLSTAILRRIGNSFTTGQFEDALLDLLPDTLRKWWDSV